MKIKAFFLVLFIAALSLNAQSWKLMRWEFMVGTGTAHIFGDFTGIPSVNNENMFGLKDIVWEDTRPSMVFAMRYKISNRFSARMNLMYGRGTADGRTNEYNPRDAVAKVNLIELSPQIEYYFIREEKKARSAAIFNRRGMLNNYSTFTAYLFTGVGGLLYNPTEIEGFFVDRRAYNSRQRGYPLEVHEKQFLFTGVIPAGIGAKYILDSRIVLGVEIGGRLTFSDKVDGFKPDQTRLVDEVYPNGSAKDFYYFTSINLSYKLRTNQNGWPILYVKPAHKTGGLPLFGGGANKARSAKEAKSGSADPSGKTGIRSSGRGAGSERAAKEANTKVKGDRNNKISNRGARSRDEALGRGKAPKAEKRQTSRSRARSASDAKLGSGDPKKSNPRKR
jgi:hypothetical protein